MLEGKNLWTKVEPYVRDGVEGYNNEQQNDHLTLVSRARLQFGSIRFWSKKYMSKNHLLKNQI